MHKLSYKSLFIIFFFLLIAVVVLSKFVLPKNKASAAWWNDGWNYRKAISIGNSGVAQTNTQIKILNNYDLSALVTAGKLQSDLDDLRFTDTNGNLLKYWIEDSTNNSADVWGIIASLPTSGATIYMYYGNSSATSVSSTLNMTIGGTMVSSGGYRIHIFNGNGTLTNANNTTAEVLVVGGGGGGASASGVGDGGGGGGGAGGLVYNASYALTQGQIINVTVGIGGTNGTTSSHQSGSDGGNSVFNTITANGGGGGGTTGVNGRSGGSGGGGGYNYYSSTKYGGSGIVGIGNSGGNTTDLASASGAGGGGAGGVGGNNITGHIGGNGGSGILYSITGSSISYANGGRGGGGSGAVNKTANTGNGGDGSYASAVATSGASGIVVVRFLSGSATSPSTEEAGGGPVAYWKFDEGSGTSTYDSTSNSHTGTLQSGTSWASEDQCVSGKCLKFDGIDDVVNVGTGNDYFPLSTFTLCTWMKSPGVAPGMSTPGIFGFTYGLRFNLNNSGQFYTSIDNGSSFIDLVAPGNLFDNNFHHLCLTYDGTNRHMFVDGIKKISSATTWLGTTRWPTNAFNIGRDNNNSTQFFKGFIDDVKIYRYARTAAQIKLDYNSRGSASSQGSGVNMGTNKNNNSLSDGLIGYWKMDEGIGTTTLDSSGNGKTGTFTSASWSSGKFGVGGSFPGSVYVDLGTNIVNTTAYTKSVWIKTNNQNANNIFSGGSGGHVLYVQSGIINLSNTWSSPNITVAANFYDNNWHLVTATYDGTKGIIYMDGIKLAEGNLSNIPANQPAYIGAYAAANQFIGLIDEVRLYNRALSPSEVSALYNYTPGPVIYYNFDEKTGTVVNDKSGNNINATFNTIGSTPTWIQGKIGGGLNFDGSSSFITANLGNNLLRKGYTFEAWAKPNNTVSNNIFWITNPNQAQLSLNNSSMYIWTNTNHSVSYSFSPTRWDYVSYVFDYGSTSVSFYVNGINIGSTYCVDNTNIGNVLNIGNSGWGWQYYKGSIDEVKIYNYPRTQKQIIEDMSATGRSASGRNAIAYYKFDEGNGDTIYNSGSGGTSLNGVKYNSTNWDNNGKYKKALLFDGNTSQLIFNNTSSWRNTGNDMSLSIWVKPDPSDDGGYIFSKAWNGSGGYNYGLSSSGGANPSFNFNLMGFSLGSNKTVSSNQWHQIIVSVDNVNKLVKFYIDGQLTNSSTHNITSWAATDNNLNFLLGCIYPYGSNYCAGTSTYAFKGYMDEFKYYNYTLTTDEVKQDYNSNAATQFGSTTQTIGATTTSLEYCIPGDTTYCASPIAEWKMDEGSGTSSIDTSGNNLNAGFSGSPTWVQGKIGKALNFNGTTDFLNNTRKTLPSGLTFGVWIKTTSTDSSVVYAGNAAQNIIGDTTGSVAFGFGVHGGKVRYQHYAGAWSGVLGSTSVNDGNWHYIGVTHNSSGTIILYVDGKQDGTGTIAYNGATGFNVIARGYSADHFTGQLDNFRIYNYARTPAQIAYDYNKGGPVGWWKFDECQGNIAYDWSGIGNTGSINIGPSGTQNSLGTCQTGTSAAWTNGSTGKLNSSLNFDGTDDYITINDNPSLNSTTGITVSAWINWKTNNQQWEWLVAKNSNSYAGTGYMLVKHSDTDAIGFMINNISATIPRTSFNTGTWYHLVGTAAAGGNANLYVNGKLVKSTSGVPNPITHYANYLGINKTSYYSSPANFNGQIDDVRIYNYALTSEQIKTLYNGGAVNFN